MIENLQTVLNFAREKKLSHATIYNRIKSGELKVITIDGIKFIDKNSHAEAKKSGRHKKNHG